MLDNAAPRTATTSGSEARGTFSISERHQAHLMEILRDTMYSDPMLAVLREYSINAWDAHVAAGKKSTPIKVHIPTSLDPTLRIRDFGLGLSEEDMFEIFPVFGESLSRLGEEEHGLMGIGSKSGFCYSDTFSVTSWHGGEKRIYVAALDSSNVGELNLLDVSPCEITESGLEISIPTRPEDLRSFEQRARQLFPFFDPPPEINIEMEIPEYSFQSEFGNLTKGSISWFAKMGCVPYRLDLNQVLKNLSDQDLQKLQGFQHLGGVLKFKMGDVQIAASREELKYTDKTKRAILGKLHELHLAALAEMTMVVVDPELSHWEKRIRVHELPFMLPYELRSPLLKEYLKTDVTLTYVDEDPFCLTTGGRYQSRANKIPGRHVDILLRDTDLDISGYGLPYYRSIYFLVPKEHVDRSWENDVVPAPTAGKTPDELLAAWPAFAERNKITGLTVQRLSSLPWTAPYKAPPRAPKARPKPVFNKKHTVSTFKIKAGYRFQTTRSENWDIEDREPQPEDVFVILNAFECPTVLGDTHHRSLYEILRQDIEVANLFNFTMPPLYGYKDTAKKPVVEETLIGTPYREWRKKKFPELLAQDPTLQVLLQRYGWRTFQSGANLYHEKSHIASGVRVLSPILGDTHPLLVMVSKYLTESDNWMTEDKREQLRHLYSLCPLFELEANQSLKHLDDTYPLLTRAGGMLELFKNKPHPSWIEYVQLVDQVREMKRKQEEETTKP